MPNTRLRLTPAAHAVDGCFAAAVAFASGLLHGSGNRFATTINTTPFGKPGTIA